MNNLLLACLGSLGMTGNNAILTEPRKTGANPELANIDKKNCVIFEEPRRYKKLQNSNIRELTGGNGMSARKCFSNDTEMTIHGTFMLACNNKPNMAGEIEIADVSRILDIRFNSRFVKPELSHLVNEEKHIYLANEEFKTDDFRMKYRCAHMKILMMAHQRYAEEKFDLKIPKCFIDNTQTYLEKSSQIGEWFLEHYEKTDDRKDYIKLVEVYDDFKTEGDGLYQSMSRAEQGRWREGSFIQHFIDDPFTGENYVELKHIGSGKERTCVRRILEGYVKRIIKSDSEHPDPEITDIILT